MLVHKKNTKKGKEVLALLPAGHKPYAKDNKSSENIHIPDSYRLSDTISPLREMKYLVFLEQAHDL